MKDFSKTNYHYFFFIILFLIQISIFNDFGFPNDEEISRFNGLVSYNYILEKFDIQILQPYPNTPKLENYIDKDYGVIFELFLVFMERLTKSTSEMFWKISSWASTELKIFALVSSE